MVRIRSKKQESLNKNSNESRSSTKQSLKEQVGGGQGDYDLVKNVKEVDFIVSGSNPSDPTLVQDVSNFLKDLEGRPDKVVKHKKESPTKSTSKPTPSNDVKSKGDKKKSKKHVQETMDVPKEKYLAPKVLLTQPKAKSLVMTPTPHWYSSVTPLPQNSGTIPSPTASQLSSLIDKASALHSADIQAYNSTSASTSSASDAQFLQKVLQSGTLSDRLSAMTLMVQGSPLHNIKALENLKNMAERGKGKGGREESLKALRCIVDWWTGGGAPDRKLRYFRDQPLLHPGVTDQHLLLWYFEDWLKKYFFSVLQILETLSLDPLTYVRTQSLSLVFALLRDKPEQEQNLLRLLVNKLGDTEKSICSRVSHHLLQLLQSHPSMKSIVVREIISLVLKPSASSATASSVLHTKQNLPTLNTKIRFADVKAPSSTIQKSKANKGDESKKGSGNLHARYYATITFNQIVLSPTPSDKKVAKELIDVYFELFKELLGEGKIEDDVLDNRDGDSEKNHTKDDQRKTQDKKKGKGKEVKGEAGFTEVEDSNSKLVSAILTGVNRALPYAKMDAGDVRFNKHIDTLFLITHKSTFNISLQALLLILQITTSMSPSQSSSSLPESIRDRYYRTLYASLFDPRLSLSAKQAMYLNLLFKSLKVDKNEERVRAFVRRFIQVLANGGGGGGAEFIVGGLYLLGELFNTVPGLVGMLQKPPSSESLEGAEGDIEHEGQQSYDPRKRDPQYAHASRSPFWELLPLVKHYHPAVSLHAQQLLTSQPLTSSPDLSLNTLSHFLDRFVYKNPKQKAKAKGSSAMQPAAGDNLSGGGVRLLKGEAGDYGSRNGKAVNDETWWKRRAQDVPVDQLFFHKYFNKKNERERAKAAKADKRKKGKTGPEMESGDEDQEDVDASNSGSDEDSEDDDGEAEIWKAMKASMPDLGVDDDPVEDSDDIPSELDDEQDSDEADDDLSLAEGSDEDDLIPLDEAFATGLIQYDGSEASDKDNEDEGYEEWGGLGGPSTAKGKRKREGEKQSTRKKKLRSLPTFASYEDYAKMIEDGPEDDV